MIAPLSPASSPVYSRKKSSFPPQRRAGNVRSSGPQCRFLADLFAGLDLLSVKGPLNRPATGLCVDSRKVRRGGIFFSLPGERTDGNLYIEEAIDRGAVAVVTDRVRYWHPDVTFIQVARVRATLATVASRFHGDPASSLEIAAVAGSMGKTSVVHLLHHLLGRSSQVGLVGTNECLLGRRAAPAERTTPDAADLHWMLAEMVEGGCSGAVLETGSVGLRRQSIDGVPLKTAVFLNLGRDDSLRHGGKERCFSLYAKLFSGEAGPPPETAVINLDDPWGRKLIQLVPPGVKVIAFGEAEHANVRAVNVETGPDGVVFRLLWPGGSAKLRSALIGRFQVSNLLAAAAAAYSMGGDLNALLPRAAAYQGTRGRMERVEAGQPFTVLVDHAHSPETMAAMLEAAREASLGRVLTVFGCGGDLGRGNRAFLVETVLEKSDFAWATSDNPRNESQERIFADMRRGVTDPQRMVFIGNRMKAIASALETAAPGDVVVIAGKGHETFQDAGGRLYPFDDCRIAHELIANLSIPVS